MKMFFILLLLTSCSKFVQETDNEYYSELTNDNFEHINLLFSHNINGETHPCGCRKFPLGGMAQAYGLMTTERKKAPTIYVDTGDTFFESINVPQFIHKSSLFKAKKIAEGLEKLGLNYYTPGDQDFAMGPKALGEILAGRKFKTLISNASPKLELAHETLGQIDIAGKKIFFIGVVKPVLLSNQGLEHLFTNPEAAIKLALEKIEKLESNTEKRVIVLMSHSGLDSDEGYAKKFPKLNWIIGAHSQSYLRYSKDVGSTYIVQVLSRNHYIGKIGLPLNNKAKVIYEQLESRDETKDLVKPNPMVAWLQQYKTEYDKLQSTEQDGFSNFASTEGYNQIPTYISCSDCHKKQVSFWQGTAHSLAFTTLIEAKANNNPACIKCHSVGMDKEGGFTGVKNIIKKDEGKVDHKTYWKDFLAKVKIKHPVRDLSSSVRKKHAKAWLDFDVKNNITANFSNVQCLNCHGQNIDHPFGDPNPMGSDARKIRCLSCHTRDQSPDWYDKDSKGLASSLNNQYFAKKLKEVSCPKIERE